MELSSKQRAYLRSLSNDLDVIVHIGKDGIGENLIKTVGDALEARELIKLSVLESCGETPRSAAEALADCGVEVIDVLGQPFDPATANAVHSLETDKEEEKNVVLEVYANGYRYGDKVLRYAQVCVGV